MKINSEANAISCDKVSHEFFIINEKLNWRIVFRDQHKNLSSYKALNNIDLTVPKGKFVGILGRNGAGKSTLLRVLGGIYTPSSGIINISGQVSSLFEMGGHGNNRLTGYSFADRYLEIYGVPKKLRKLRIENIRDFSELGNDFDNPIYTYSSGMGARLYFSTATELQSEIYLVDELLSVGDEHFQAKCWKRLRERFMHGASGILVTHDWSAILKLCEYSYILDQGVIVNNGQSDKMVQHYLNLPVPGKEIAEIVAKPDGYTVESGINCTLDFDIILKQAIDLEINYSIELFRGGYGWELMLLNNDYFPLSCKLGLNRVSLEIKTLPLAPGSYYLNIFLRSKDSTIDSFQLDSRSWTYGNGIKLSVTGQKTPAITRLPWKKNIKALTHAAP